MESFYVVFEHLKIDQLKKLDNLVVKKTDFGKNLYFCFGKIVN